MSDSTAASQVFCKKMSGVYFSAISHCLRFQSRRRIRCSTFAYIILCNCSLYTLYPNTHYAVTARAGWHGTAYILPSGEVIRPDNAEAGRVIYNGDKSQAPAYEAAGTAQEWNAEIGQYLTGNSRLRINGNRKNILTVDSKLFFISLFGYRASN